MKLRIVNTGLSYMGSEENPDIYIDGVAASLVIVTGPGSGGLIDGLPGADWTPTPGVPLHIEWPVVLFNGRPVRYDQRIRLVGKMKGILSITYLDE